jgi:hypothetical protein
LPKTDELHQLRQEFAVAFHELSERHRQEDRALQEKFYYRLLERGVAEEDLTREWLYLIREAFPTTRDFDLTGLGRDDAP